MHSSLPVAKPTFFRFTLAVLTFLLLGSAQLVRADSYTFTTFYGLDATGLTYIGDINNSGQLIGTSDGQGFIYSNGVFSTLPGTPLAINNNGVVLGSYNSAHTYYLYSNGSYSNVTPPSGYDPTYIRYAGINDAGTLVATYTTFTGSQVYQEYGQPNVLTYGPSGVTSFPLGVPSSNAVGINNAGTTIGDLATTIDREGVTGFVATNGSITYVTFPFSGPYGYYPGSYTSFLSINNSGQILGSYYKPSQSGYFIYSNGVFTDLQFPSGYAPSAINDAGQIAGSFFNGYNPTNLHAIENGFIATPVASSVPEPANFLLTVLLLPAAGWFLRCRPANHS